MERVRRRRGPPLRGAGQWLSRRIARPGCRPSHGAWTPCRTRRRRCSRSSPPTWTIAWPNPSPWAWSPPRPNAGRATGWAIPPSLGRSIRKARRSRKSALALVGGSAVALGAGTAIGAVAGFIALYLAWTAASVAVFAIAHGNGWSPPAVYAALAAVAIGLSLAARVAPAFVAAQVRWPFSTVRRVVAALILVAGLAIALLLPNQDLDGWLALLYPAIPIVAAVIALTAPRTGARGAWKPAAAIVLGSIVLMPIAWPYPADAPLGFPAADVAAIGQVADFDEDLPPPTGVSAGQSEDELGRRVFQQSFSDLNGWHDFTDELWPLERAGGGWQLAAIADAHGALRDRRAGHPRPI